MLLDTCALLWLASGSDRLSEQTKRLIDQELIVHVCAISAFEVSIKVQRGKLDLPATPSDWFERVIDHHHLSVIPLDIELCMRAPQLPAIHKDPCDRFIISAALTHRLSVVTADTRFASYGVDVLMC